MFMRALFIVCSTLLLANPAPGWARRMLYADDFETRPLNNWELEPGWGLVRDADNVVLRGEGHSWARLQSGREWSDYIIRARLKLFNGGIHCNFRVSEEGRYFVGFAEHGVYLNKETPWGKFQELGAHATPLQHDAWYDIEIRGVRGIIQVYVDDVPVLEVEDENPLFAGSIAFETIEDSFAFIDNVEVYTSQQVAEISSSGAGSADMAASILTPLYMYYLKRYFSDHTGGTEIDQYIRSILDASPSARKMSERALANYQAIPLVTRTRMLDAEVVAMTNESSREISLEYIRDRLRADTPILGKKFGDPPVAPSNLVAQNTSRWDQEFPHHEITLQWQTHSTNADGFRLYRVFKPSGNPLPQKTLLVTSVGPTVTTYRDLLTKPANPLDMYCYYLKAFKVSPLALIGQQPQVNESGPSNAVCESYATTPPPKPADTDGDGIPDFLDACPSQKGTLTHGCPDKDEDGIPNKDDFCPSLPGVASGKYIPKNRHGCPQRYTLRWLGMQVLNNSAAYAYSGIKVLPDKQLYDNEKYNDNKYGGGEEPYLVFTWNNGITSKGTLEHGASRWCCGEGVGVESVKPGDFDEPDNKPFGEEPSNPPLKKLLATGLAIWPPAGLYREIDTELGLGLNTTLMERDFDATITVQDEIDALEAAFKIGGKVTGTVAGCVGSGGLGCLVAIGSTIKSVIEDILGLSQPKTTITVNDPDDPQGTDFWAITASEAAAKTASNGAYPFYFQELPTDARWFCTWIPCNVGNKLPRYMRIKPYFCLCREGMSAAEIEQHCAASKATVVLPWPMKAP